MKKLIKKWDILLIGILLIISLFAFVLINSFSQNGDTVTLKVNGETISTFSISENNEYTIKNNSKVVGILHIKDKKVYISDATCKDKICEKQKEISKSGESTICLPNSIVVSIDSNDNEIDGVVR